MKFYSITPNDLRANTDVISREQWDKYKCPGCGKLYNVDLLKAERVGADPLPARLPDFFQTDDYVYIVSQNAKETIESFPGSNVQMFPLLKRDDYFALLPNHLIFPPEKIRVTPAVDFAGEPFRAVCQHCLACGRYPEICFDVELFTVPASRFRCAFSSRRSRSPP